MTTFKLVIATALGLCATTAAAQERQIVCTNPNDPFNSVCIDLSRGPQLKPARPQMPRTVRPQRPDNPGIDAVVDRLTTDPVEDEIKRRVRWPKYVPTSKPSPGQVFCLYTEPCAAFVDASWPDETSRDQTTKSDATARLERQRHELDDALKDPSEFPTYQSACWPRSVLEQRRCDVQQQLERAQKADVERSLQRHYDAYETGQMVERFRDALRNPNLDPQMRRWAEQEVNNWQRATESYTRKGIEPYAPPTATRVPIPTPPPLKGQRPERPRTSVPSGPVHYCPAGASCGIQ